jgi:hypothetical protein
MSEGSQGSGISPWLVGLLGYGLYRRGRRRAQRDAERDQPRGDWRGRRQPGGPLADFPLREVRLPDGREALQVTASMFEPDPDSSEVWRRVTLEGAASSQDALALTVSEVAREGVDASTGEVPMVLMPLGTHRRVEAVDVHATGGLVGQLPDEAVRAVGESLRATHLAQGQPCAVPGRIHRHGPSGLHYAEVLLPEAFEPADDD